MLVSARTTRLRRDQSSKINVLRCIQARGPINRSAIAQEVHLSIPAVMSITDELVRRGILVTVGRTGSGVGKHPELYDISGERFRCIGVDIGRTMERTVITGLDGSLLACDAVPTEMVDDPRRFVDRVCERIVATVRKARIDESTVVGVCVAMPGLIEQGSGRVVFSPNFGWQDVPMQEWMNQRLPYQVIVENANRAQAFWEVRPGRGNEGQTVFCAGLGYGIGAALIQNGQVYYGSSGTSGEFGHITVCARNGRQCSCGNTGCLESVASGAAIAAQGRELVEAGRAPLLAELCGGDADRVDARLVFQAADAGDADAAQLVEMAAEYIGIALAISINMLDPDEIYLCGGLMKNGDRFLERIKYHTRRRQMHFAGRHVVIRAGSMDDWHVARGATLMLLENGQKFDAISFLY